ncbi:unnamed protein product [Dicrocoelium dendriticum]|nr:unnamed protein product [Dicrocoelium dendriticum]
MNQFAVLLITLVQVAQLTSGTQYNDCGSTMGSLSEVSVTPCDSSPCILYKGENTRVTVKFTTSRRITTGTFLFSGIIDGQEIPFNLTNSYICPYMRPRCPLRANGTVYTFTYSLPVQASYPSVSLKLETMQAFICH